MRMPKTKEKNENEGQGKEEFMPDDEGDEDYI